MRIQNQIKRTLSEEQNIEHIREVLGREGGMTRTELAKRICEDFGFVDWQGEPQVSGCMKALRRLEGEGCFELPAGKRGASKGCSYSPRRLAWISTDNQ